MFEVSFEIIVKLLCCLLHICHDLPGDLVVRIEDQGRVSQSEIDDYKKVKRFPDVDISYFPSDAVAAMALQK